VPLQRGPGCRGQSPSVAEGGIDDQDIGFEGPIAKFPGNNPQVDGYKETATFNSGSPTNAAVASILATDIR
jgi:hypothetical protein